MPTPPKKRMEKRVDEPITNVGETLSIICRNLIRQREMKNADTQADYCFWMHHDTAADILVERQKQERGYMLELGYLWGVQVNLDSKMELGEIALVKKSPTTSH